MSIWKGQGPDNWKGLIRPTKEGTFLVYRYYMVNGKPDPKKEGVVKAITPTAEEGMILFAHDIPGWEWTLLH